MSLSPDERRWPTWEMDLARKMWRAGKSATIIVRSLCTNRSRAAVISKLAKMGEIGNPMRRTLERVPAHPPPPARKRVHDPRKILPTYPPVPVSQRSPHWRVVADAVVAASGVSMKQIRSIERSRKVVAARHALVWLMRKHCKNASTPVIGRRINRDHTTVLWILAHVNKLLTNQIVDKRGKAIKVQSIIDNVKARIERHGDYRTDQD